jgi:hypothetical protein
MTETLKRTTLFAAVKALPLSDKFALLDQIEGWIEQETAPSEAELAVARARLAAYRAHPEDAVSAAEVFALFDQSAA